MKSDVPKAKYKKDFSCNNCGQVFTKVFEFGEVARKGSCPHCGVSDEQINQPYYLEEKL